MTCIHCRLTILDWDRELRRDYVLKDYRSDSLNWISKTSKSTRGVRNKKKPKGFGLLQNVLGYSIQGFLLHFTCKGTSVKSIMNSLNQVFTMFELPAYLHSDRGNAFMSDKFKCYLLDKVAIALPKNGLVKFKPNIVANNQI